jgi:hypothetical protein
VLIGREVTDGSPIASSAHMRFVEHGRVLPAALLLTATAGCAVRSSPVRSAERLASAEGDVAAFVVRLGTDTIMLERFVTQGAVTQGDIIDRSPTLTKTHYDFAIDSRGGLTHLAVEVRDAKNGAWNSTPVWLATVTRARDGFELLIKEGDSTKRKTVRASADALLLFSRPVSLYDVIARRLRRSHADSLAVPLLDPDTTLVREVVVRKLGPDSIIIPLIFPRGERARVDSVGRILGVNGLATSYKWLTERVPDFDIAALGRTFASREVAAGAFGNYSARDTARAQIGDAHIAIDYGRPSKRGRVIFGELVPWNQVWRMGADLATNLTTDRTLDFAGVRLSAGTYSLYALPTQDRWTLIVNRQTGQSGLVYDASADIARVAMTTSRSSRQTERLTITLEARAGGGVLRLAWGDVIAEAPFKIVP